MPLRQCTGKLSARGTASECALGQMGRCGAPCSGRQSVEEYAAVVGDAIGLLTGDARPVTDALLARMAALSEQERFEDAGTVRDRLLHLVRAAARTQRIAPLAVQPADRRGASAEAGGWELVCVRFGRLAGTSVSPPGADPMIYVRNLCRHRRGRRGAGPPVARGDARGDGDRPALARGTRRADRRDGRLVVLPGGRRRGVRALLDDRRPERRRAVRPRPPRRRLTGRAA